MANIPDGYELLPGHSRDNARKAISTAESRGLGAETVLSIRDGYLIPLGDEGARQAESDGEEVEEVEVEEIVIPDPEKTKHEDIDAFADEHGLSYDGIEADNPDKPTRAEKIAHLTKALDAKARANDEHLEQTGELRPADTNKED